MYFQNINDLLNMDGHGFYVWTAYGITAVVLVSMVLSPLARRRRALNRIALRRRDALAQQGMEN